MLWSISSTPASCSSRTERTTSANSGTSASGSPAAGSSISTKRRLGREHARDAEAALVAVGERGGRRLAERLQAEQLEQLAPTRRRASRGPAPAPSAATSTFSRTERPPNERLCWKVRARPARARRCGLQPVISRPPSSTDPDVRPVEAAEDVHERRLAGAVRPDQPDDLVPAHLERHLLQRLHALEGPRHGGGPEGVSGPPLGSCGGRRLGTPLALDLRDDLGRHRADELGLVVLDLDHAVAAAEDRVQLRREADLAAEHVGTFLNFSSWAASTEPFSRAVRALDRDRRAPSIVRRRRGSRR